MAVFILCISIVVAFRISIPYMLASLSTFDIEGSDYLCESLVTFMVFHEKWINFSVAESKQENDIQLLRYY